MLSPDESALLQNIKSLLEQLGQVDAGAQAVSGQLPDPAMMSADPLMNQNPEGEEQPMENEGMPMDDQDPTKVSPETTGEEDDTVEKADQDGTAVIATDSPEDKAEDANTSITEENLKVLKSLVETLEKMGASKKTTVAKSAGAQSSINDSAIVSLSAGVAELAKVVKSINARQSAIETAVVNILQGAGIPEMVQKSQTQKKPVLTTTFDMGHPSNVNSVVQKSAGSIVGQPEQPALKGRDAVRKSLSELLPSMVSGRV